MRDGDRPTRAPGATDLEAPAARMILACCDNAKPAHWLSDRLSIPVIEMAYTVGGADTADDLFGLYEHTIASLEEYR